MSLSFLVPAFLIGLAALAVPILIHLTRRQTKESVDFPSLMFVARVPHRSTARRRIRNWPLLLMRCLAIALITLAFARPFLQREEASAAPVLTGARETVILLDRSYSMSYGDRWARAKQEASARIESMRTNDRVSLILFDSRSEAAAESSPDKAMLRAALGAAGPSSRATRYSPALRYAERLLTASPHPRREVVVISDFQRNGWEKDAGEARSIRFPAGTVITPVSIGNPNPSNVVVGSVSFTRTLAAGRERAVATARLVNQGDRAQPALPVTLEIDGRRVDTRTVSLDANGGTATVEFAPVTLTETGVTRGVVRTPADSLPADNNYFFGLSPDQRIGVVLVDGSGGGQGNFFLERALSIGDTPGFRTVSRPEGGLTAADLTQASVVVLNQARIPGGELGNRLRTFVENGGGVLMLLGDSRTGGWEGVMPDRRGSAVDHGDAGIALGFIDFGHPAFSAFSTPRSGDFTGARFYRYRQLPSGTNQRVLARFSDGGTALTEQPVGKGRVMVWAASMDADATDLAVQPVFLPFMHELVKHASGYAQARPAFTVGDPFDPAAAAVASQQFGLAISPSGDRFELDQQATLTLDEPGFYQLRDGRSGAGSSVVAVNVDPTESNMEAVPATEVVSAITPRPEAGSRSGGPLALTLQDKEREQSAWWYLVVVGFLLLAAETAISNWRKRESSVVSRQSPVR
ncbi:MAG: BatA domain-containing protein [Gemmatimonadetes bacterium]|nr:BatA domain-containing protein [Gemmatimonadota bacterium]